MRRFNLAFSAKDNTSDSILTGECAIDIFLDTFYRIEGHKKYTKQQEGIVHSRFYIEYLYSNNSTREDLPMCKKFSMKKLKI